jgi:hypothetical protein
MSAGAAALKDKGLGDRRAAGLAGQHAADRPLSTLSGRSPWAAHTFATPALPRFPEGGYAAQD